MVLNQARIIRESNATFARMVGGENRQIDGKPFTDFLIPGDQAIFRARLRSFFRQPVDKHIELQLNSADKTCRYIDLAATIQKRDETRDDMHHELFVTVNDVTERVEAQKKLQQSQDFIAAVIDSLDSHICVLDETGTILLVNKAWRRFAAENSPSTDDLVEGTNYLAACENAQGEDMECARRFAAGIRSVLRDEKETFSLEYPCHSPHKERWFTGIVTRLEANIAFGKIVVAHQNITERKELEKEQRYLHDQLKQIAKAESLGLMAGSIAPNFNKFISTVVGNLGLARTDKQDAENVETSVQDALSAAWRATEISNLMLTYLGLQASDLQPGDFSTICSENLAKIYLPRPGEIAISTDFPSPGPQVSADSKQIQQLLSNLVINAWEAMDDKPGKIHLEISTVHSAKIGDRFRFPLDWQPEDKNYACLSVRDTGGGIAEEDIEKIFDPFFTRKFLGRGLGLSVILGIVRSHEGAISVESQIGNGTVFRVYLPVCPA